MKAKALPDLPKETVEALARVGCLSREASLRYGVPVRGDDGKLRLPMRCCGRDWTECDCNKQVQ